MFSGLRKLLGGRSGSTHGVAGRGNQRRLRLEVEALDERVLPSTVPILTGDTLYLNSSNTRSLQITSETDLGNGTGMFTGWFQDASTWTYVQVRGSLYDKSAYGGYRDVGVAYFGGASSSFYSAWVSGSGDFITSTVTDNPSAYNPGGGASWWYQGIDYASSTWNMPWLSWLNSTHSAYNSDYATPSVGID